MTLRIISIGYERAFLDSESEASKRLERSTSAEYASSMIVLSAGAEAKREYPNGSVFAFSGIGIVRMWKAFFRIVGEIKRAKSSGESVLIVAQDPFISGMLAFKISRWLNVPYEVQEHGDHFNGYWKKESLMNCMMSRIGAFVIRRADNVRVVSERVKDRLIKKFDVSPERIFVRAVDTDLSWHLSQPIHERSTIPVIIAPCRFVKQKGLELLLNALAIVKSRGIEFRLRLVGSGPLEQSLRRRIELLNLSDRVTIEPWASQESLWTHTDLFVLSSFYEGWARTITEAMATRTPIVATDVGCVGSLLRPQIDGRVVSIGNTQAFADAIAEQLTEKERREWMVTQAYDRIKDFASHRHEVMEEQRKVWSGVGSREWIALNATGVDRVERDGNQSGAVGCEPWAVSRSAWKWTVLLVGSAILLRALSFTWFWKSLGVNREWGFFTLVQNWFLGNGYSYVNALGCASAYRSPGYLFILTAIYSIFGFANFFAQALIQNIVAVIFVYAVYRLAVEIFQDRRIGWIAGAIAMLHPYTFYHYTQYYHTVFSSLFIILILYFVLKLERTKRFRWAIGAGIWVASLAYIQGTILPVMPLISLWLIYRWRAEWKKAIASIAVIACVSAGLIAPWTIRNWFVFHSFVPLTTDLGHGFAKSNNDHIYYYNLLGYPQEAYEEAPITDDGLTMTYAMYPEVKADMTAHGFNIPKGYFMDGIHPIEPSYRYTCTDQAQMNEVEFNQYWMRKGSTWIKENYSSVGWKIQLQKLEQFWSPILQPTKRYGAAWSFGNEGILAMLVKFALAGYVLFLEIGSLIGLYFIAKKKGLGRIAPLLILIAVYSFMHSIFAGYTKYRVPLDSLLAIFTAVSVISIWDLVMKKRTKKNRV